MASTEVPSVKLDSAVAELLNDETRLQGLRNCRKLLSTAQAVEHFVRKQGLEKLLQHGVGSSAKKQQIEAFSLLANCCLLSAEARLYVKEHGIQNIIARISPYLALTSKSSNALLSASTCVRLLSNICLSKECALIVSQARGFVEEIVNAFSSFSSHTNEVDTPFSEHVLRFFRIFCDGGSSFAQRLLKCDVALVLGQFLASEKSNSIALAKRCLELLIHFASFGDGRLGIQLYQAECLPKIVEFCVLERSCGGDLTALSQPEARSRRLALELVLKLGEQSHMRIELCKLGVLELLRNLTLTSKDERTRYLEALSSYCKDAFCRLKMREQGILAVLLDEFIARASREGERESAWLAQTFLRFVYDEQGLLEMAVYPGFLDSLFTQIVFYQDRHKCDHFHTLYDQKTKQKRAIFRPDSPTYLEFAEAQRAASTTVSDSPLCKDFFAASATSPSFSPGYASSVDSFSMSPSYSGESPRMSPVQWSPSTQGGWSPASCSSKHGLHYNETPTSSTSLVSLAAAEGELEEVVMDVEQAEQEGLRKRCLGEDPDMDSNEASVGERSGKRRRTDETTAEQGIGTERVRHCSCKDRNASEGKIAAGVSRGSSVGSKRSNDDEDGALWCKASSKNPLEINFGVECKECEFDSVILDAVLHFLSRLSHNDRLSSELVRPRYVRILVEYIAEACNPHPRAVRLLRRLVQTHYLEQFFNMEFHYVVYGALCRPAKVAECAAVHAGTACWRCLRNCKIGCELLTQFRLLMDSGYGEGIIGHRLMLASTSYDDKLSAACAAGLLVRQKQRFAKLMIEYKGLHVLIDAIKSTDTTGQNPQQLTKVITSLCGCFTSEKLLDQLRPNDQLPRCSTEDVCILESSRLACTNIDEVSFRFSPDDVLHVPKSLLVAKSAVYSTMFSSEFLEARQSSIVVSPDQRRDCFVFFLHWLVGCRQCPTLRSLSPLVDVGDCLEIIDLAVQHLQKELVERVVGAELPEVLGGIVRGDCELEINEAWFLRTMLEAAVCVGNKKLGGLVFAVVMLVAMKVENEEGQAEMRERVRQFFRELDGEKLGEFVHWYRLQLR